MKMRSERRAIDKIFKRRDNYDIPDWQRSQVWTKSKKQRLIDSILRGWKLPKFYFLKTGDEPKTYDVVDGQQRLISIYDFFSDKLALSDESEQLFGGKYFSKLPESIADHFEDYEIEFDEIEDASDKEISDFFLRLQEGSVLTSAEKLNAIPGQFTQFVRTTADHPFFKKIKVANIRHSHFDIAAKVAAIEVDGIDLNLRYDDLSAVFEAQKNFSDSSNVAKRVIGALAFLDQGFGTDTSRLRNRTIVQTILTLACKLVSNGKAAGWETKIANFYNTFIDDLTAQVELGANALRSDFLDFQQTVSANVPGGAKIRQEILLRRLVSVSPEVADILGPALTVEIGIQTSISLEKSKIVDLISEINSVYSTRHGEDLFKPTNRTVSAQNKLADPCSNVREYKEFIDECYFLFWESVGSRLEGNWPISFKDVNSLRIDERHDLDHGDEKKVKAKKIRIGEIFKKYSGSESPETAGPEKFALLKFNLLQSVRQDLEQLRASVSRLKTVPDSLVPSP